jgi:hypothetical protein
MRGEEPGHSHLWRDGLYIRGQKMDPPEDGPVIKFEVDIPSGTVHDRYLFFRKSDKCRMF